MEHLMRVSQERLFRKGVAVAILFLIAGLAVTIAVFGRGADAPLSGSSGLPGHPGSIWWGWQILDHEGTGERIDVQVHHVIASRRGIHVVYSARADADSGQTLSSAVLTRRVIDGVVTGDPIDDYLVATNGMAAVRIASIGMPVLGVTTYGMNLTGLDARDRADSFSIDVVADETPGVIEGTSSVRTNPDLEVAHLLDFAYSVTSRDGSTFGVRPRSVVETETTTYYFMLSRSGTAGETLREITFDELVAFNRENIREVPTPATAKSPANARFEPYYADPDIAGCEKAGRPDLIARTEAERVAVSALSSSSPRVSGVEIQRIEVSCLATLRWLEEDLLQGISRSNPVLYPPNMPVWVIQVRGDSSSERPGESFRYSYAIAAVDARSGEIMKQSYLFEPLLSPE